MKLKKKMIKFKNWHKRTKSIKKVKKKRKVKKL